MIEALKNLFVGKKVKKYGEYSGLSDFFLHAPESVKKEAITEAARKANEDQLEVFTKARLKIRAN